MIFHKYHTRGPEINIALAKIDEILVEFDYRP